MEVPVTHTTPSIEDIENFFLPIAPVQPPTIIQNEPEEYSNSSQTPAHTADEVILTSSSGPKIHRLHKWKKRGIEETSPSSPPPTNNTLLNNFMTTTKKQVTELQNSVHLLYEQLQKTHNELTQFFTTLWVSKLSSCFVANRSWYLASGYWNHKTR